ncbi:MAG: histidine phosphatase family protein [Candidatus Kariarchaeaceae archaeon]
MIIDFVRHAQSEGNAVRMLQGQYNSPLSKIGREQAVALTQKLDFPYDQAYSSTLDRAFETAKITLHGSYEGSIITKDGLQEMNFGSLEQISLDDFDLDMKKTWDQMINEPNFKGHGGESRDEFVHRVAKTIQIVVEEAESRGMNKIVIFTHGGVIRVLFQYLLKIDRPTVSNTQIMRFQHNNGKLEFVKEIK